MRSTTITQMLTIGKLQFSRTLRIRILVHLARKHHNWQRRSCDLQTDCTGQNKNIIATILRRKSEGSATLVLCKEIFLTICERLWRIGQRCFMWRFKWCALNIWCRIHVTNPHKTSRKLGNSVSRKWFKIRWKAFSFSCYIFTNYNLTSFKH